MDYKFAFWIIICLTGMYIIVKLLIRSFMYKKHGHLGIESPMLDNITGEARKKFNVWIMKQRELVYFISKRHFIRDDSFYSIKTEFSDMPYDLQYIVLHKFFCEQNVISYIKPTDKGMEVFCEIVKGNMHTKIKTVDNIFEAQKLEIGMSSSIYNRRNQKQ